MNFQEKIKEHLDRLDNIKIIQTRETLLLNNKSDWEHRMNAARALRNSVRQEITRLISSQHLETISFDDVDAVAEEITKLERKALLLSDIENTAHSRVKATMIELQGLTPADRLPPQYITLVGELRAIRIQLSSLMTEKLTTREQIESRTQILDELVVRKAAIEKELTENWKLLWDDQKFKEKVAKAK
jgi:hypothetical protein